MVKKSFDTPRLSVEDLTLALYEVNKELTQVNERLVQSEKNRRELLANISHDLRSPVATIKNYIEYLLSFPELDRQETMSAMGCMQDKVLVLEHLMNEMLALSALDGAAGQSLNSERIRIDRFLKTFFDSCKNDLKYKDCALALCVPGDFAHFAHIDAKLLYRALENLFSNALKYTKRPCSITLGATCKNGEITVFVADNGIGIDQADLKRIFERTYMVSGARTPGREAGCGLGLSIVESIIHRHKGRVWCESTPEEGSVFYFTLPEATEPI